MLGAFMIENVMISIEGSKVQSFPGEWIAVRATADMSAERYAKWCAMVGHTPEIHSPEWGVHGKSASYPFQKGSYPHAVADPSGATIPIAPSIHGRQLRIPLPFWFSEGWGTALPLIALQLHTVEVTINLRPLRELYRLMDDYFQSEPTRSGRRLLYNPGLPTQNDPTAMLPAGVNQPYTNLTLQTNYQSYLDVSGSLRNFFTDPTAPSIPRQDGFIMNAHLEGNYVYLTESERNTFVKHELTHLVHQVQTFPFPSIVSQQRLKLDIHGLLHRLIFFARRTDAIPSRNDYLNLTNWKYANQAPYWPLNGTNPYTPNSGQLISYAQRDILRTARLLLDGNELQEAKPANYYEVQVPFMTTEREGVGPSGGGQGQKPNDVLGPLYQMAFCLNASDHVNPSGSLNVSRIRDVSLEVTPWDLDPYSAFAYDFTVYEETLNLIRFTNGMGGVAFAI